MARGGITEFHVFRAANALAAAGETNPTNKNIRAKLGNTGSETTISKHMKVWRQQYLLPESDSGLPSPVVASLTGMFADMIDSAQGYVDEHRAEIDIELENAKTELTLTLEKLSNAFQEISDLKNNVADEQARSRSANEEVEHLKEESIRDGAKRDNLLQEITSLNVQDKSHCVEIQELKLELRRCGNDYSQAKVTLAGTSADLAAKTRELETATKDHEKTLQDKDRQNHENQQACNEKLARREQTADSLREQASKDSAKSERQINELQRETGELSGQLKQAQVQISEQFDQNTALKEELERLRLLGNLVAIRKPVAEQGLVEAELIKAWGNGEIQDICTGFDGYVQIFYQDDIVPGYLLDDDKKRWRHFEDENKAEALIKYIKRGGKDD